MSLTTFFQDFHLDLAPATFAPTNIICFVTGLLLGLGPRLTNLGFTFGQFFPFTIFTEMCLLVVLDLTDLCENPDLGCGGTNRHFHVNIHFWHI